MHFRHNKKLTIIKLKKSQINIPKLVFVFVFCPQSGTITSKFADSHYIYLPISQVHLIVDFAIRNVSFKFCYQMREKNVT